MRIELTQDSLDTVIAALRAWEHFRRYGAWPDARSSLLLLTAIAGDSGEPLVADAVGVLGDRLNAEATLAPKQPRTPRWFVCYECVREINGTAFREFMHQIVDQHPLVWIKAKQEVSQRSTNYCKYTLMSWRELTTEDATALGE